MKSFEFRYCVVSFDDPSKSVFLRTTYLDKPEEMWRSVNKGTYYDALRKVGDAHRSGDVGEEWKDRGMPTPYGATTHELLSMLKDVVGLVQVR